MNIISDINFLSNDSIWILGKSFNQINDRNVTDYDDEMDIIIKYAIYFLVKLII